MARSVVRTACVAAWAGVLASALGASQATPPPPPQQRPPTFRGGAVLVTVDVYPQRDGRIVEGLTAADFEVLEDGRPQAVENFEFVRIEPSLSESERRDPSTQAEALQLAADPHNRVFVVFLDALHVDVEGSHNIRRPLVDTLNRIVAPNDLFGVMTQNIEPRHLTLGRRLLTVEEQLTKYWPWGERWRLGTDPNDPVENELRVCFERPPGGGTGDWVWNDNGYERPLYKVLIDRRREDRTLTSLEGLIDFLAGLREARTVALLVSEGWTMYRGDLALANELARLGPTRPGLYVGGAGQLAIGTKPEYGTDPARCMSEAARLALLENEPRLRLLIDRANRANVSFYPVTPGGLATFDVPISEKYQPSLVVNQDRLRNRMDSLRVLAQNTDGLAIVNTNDLGGGMRRIVDDVSAYYLLGYYSTNTKNDGKFRRIEVKLKKPGMQTRARRGYMAPGPVASDAGARSAARLPAPVAASPAGVDEALAPLARLRTTSMLYTRGVVVGDQVDVAVEIASTRAGAAPWNTGADVQVTVTGVDGRSLAPVTAHIAPGTRGISVRAPTAGAAPPIRITTRVSAGGEALDDSFEMRADSRAATGDAVLFRGRPAGTSPLYAVADLQFRRAERVHVEWPSIAATDQRIARLLGRNGQPLAIPVSLTEREVNGARVLAADLSLAPLTTGDYLLELVVERGGVSERRLTAFRVIQ